MVLSEQQRKDLIERLKKGREAAKQNKIELEERGVIDAKPTPTPTPAKPSNPMPFKEPEPPKPKVKHLMKIKHEPEPEPEPESNTEESEEIKLPPKKNNKKVDVVPLEKAFDNIQAPQPRSKPIDIKKPEPYLKIKLYKEPSNPSLITSLVNDLNQLEKPVEKPVKPKKANPEESTLKDLCKLYFN